MKHGMKSRPAFLRRSSIAPALKGIMLDRLHAESSRLTYAGGTLCYVQRGRGPAVLLVHGIPLSLVTWRLNFDFLSERFTVVALDLKGFGLSTATDKEFAPRDHARAIEALVDQLGFLRISIVANSYGCAPALNFAVVHPERVERLVLIDSVGESGGSRIIQRLLGQRAVLCIFGLLLDMPRVSRLLFARRLRRAYARPDLIPSELVDYHLQLLRRNARGSGFLQTLQQFSSKDFVRTLREIQQETLLIWGEQDRLSSVADAQCLERVIAHAHLVVVPNCGHLPHEEASGEVNRLVGDFLSARCLSRPGSFSLPSETPAAYVSR